MFVIYVVEGMQCLCVRVLNIFRFDLLIGMLGKILVNVFKFLNYLFDCWEKIFILIGFKFGFNLQYNGIRFYREFGGR